MSWICANYSDISRSVIIEIIEKSSEQVSKESTTPVANDNATVIEAAQRKAKLQTVPQLAKLGLTAEQIAQALELPMDEVEQVIP